MTCVPVSLVVEGRWEHVRAERLSLARLPGLDRALEKFRVRTVASIEGCCQRDQKNSSFCVVEVTGTVSLLLEAAFPAVLPLQPRERSLFK